MPAWKLQGSSLIENRNPNPEPKVDKPPVVVEFDPADHTIDEVKAHVNENPDQTQAVLDAELDGKNRVTLVEWLEG